MRQRELRFEGLTHFFYICQRDFILGHDREILHTEHTPGPVIVVQVLTGHGHVYVYILSC